MYTLFLCTAPSYEGLQNISKRAGPMYYSFETSEKGLLNKTVIVFSHTTAGNIIIGLYSQIYPKCMCVINNFATV